MSATLFLKDRSCSNSSSKKLDEFELLDIFAEVHVISSHVMENINDKTATTKCLDISVVHNKRYI